MNWIQKFFTKQFSVAVNNTMLQSIFRYWGTNTPIWFDDRPEVYIKEGYAGNADVYSIVKRIIDLGSSIPWKVQEKKNGKWVDIQDHELQLLIESPNPVMSQQDFISSLMGYYLLTGDAFTFAPFLENGPNKGKTKELWPMSSHLIGIKFGDMSNPIKGYYYINRPEELIDPETVCHVKTWNPDSNGYAFRGMSPLRAASKNVKMGNSAVEAEVKSFENMGPDGILSRDGEEFTQIQSENLERRFKDKYMGVENAKKIVMTGASVKWQQLGLSPVDLNILESKKYNMATLCNIYGAPVQIFNNTDKTAFNNMDAAHKQMYLHAVLPVLNAIAKGFQRWLVPRWGSNLWLVPDLSAIEVLQSNKKEQVEWLEKAWWMKGIDKQRAMGLTEDPEMDKYYIPSSLIASDDMGEDLVNQAREQLAGKGFNDYEV
jgi:HK97 family phage portal protein